MACLTYGVWDLLHYGHLRVIKKAKKLSNKFIIGVYTDKVAEGFKRKPVLNENERLEMIKELGIADEVCLLDDYIPTQEWLNNKGVRIVAKAEGAGWTEQEQPQWSGIRSVFLPYTEGISTSQIIKRINDNIK